jgi:hypothetical protein
MNAWNERWRDSDNFGARITGIGVVVEKIWWKEFHRPICIFWKVARANMEIYSESRGFV